MAISNFPPQAYTRDMLASAYEWLRHQPPSTRELAQDSDSLVALYMQSRRRNGAQTNHSQTTMGTSSAESFKQELKTLTEGLKQFESPTATHASPTVHQVAPQATQPVMQTPTNYGSQTTVHTPVAQQPAITQPVSTAKANEFQLDARSLEAIHIVKHRLNLSSDSETLRMMIAMGFDKIREFLPKM